MALVVHVSSLHPPSSSETPSAVPLSEIRTKRRRDNTTVSHAIPFEDSPTHTLNTDPHPTENVAPPTPHPSLYIGIDEEEDPILSTSEYSNPLHVHDTPSNIPEDTPEIVLEPSECQALWQPRKRALILKLLGCNISFLSLKQRLQDLWCFRWGFELVDLDGGFFVVRFYTKVD